MATLMFQSAKRFFTSAARTSSRLQARMSATRDPIKLTPAAVARIQELLSMKNEGASGSSSSDSSGDEAESTAADGVRIGVKKGGCNGLEYSLNYAIPKVNDLPDDVVITVDQGGVSDSSRTQQSSDSSEGSSTSSSSMTTSTTAEAVSSDGMSVSEQNKIRVIVENRALFYLIGTTVDFQEDDLRAGFVFDNPNVTSKCGCEQSFSV